MIKQTKTGAHFIGSLLLIAQLLVGWTDAAVDVEHVHPKLETGGDSVKLHFETDPTVYYEVWKSQSLIEWQLAKIVLGTGQEHILSEMRSQEQSKCYYKLASRLVSEHSDADGDGFDDVYELKHGMDPLVASALHVTKITVAKSQIAAGALATAPHQTKVVIQVVPPGPTPVIVWLDGGTGSSAASSSDGNIHPISPAKLCDPVTSPVAEAGGPSAAQPLLMNASATGEVILTLTSSNVVGDHCTVRAQAGTMPATGPGQAGTVRAAEPVQASSPEVSFEAGTMTMDFPAVLTPGTSVPVVVTRSFNGEPLAGHETLIYVNRAQVDGKSLVAAGQLSSQLDPYALVDATQQRQTTDASGLASANVLINDPGGLGSVEMKACDLQVITTNP
ncbi:MAG: hypothetical protein ORN51_02900 [Akkermansiaceae bacterium]|nr:hypothetical protein [Akkermansiaceae bacterium]